MKQLFTLISFIAFWLAIPLISIAQESPEETKRPFRAFLISPVFAVDFPFADLSERFGTNLSFGMQVDYILNGYFFGFETDFLFGSKVKTDVLAQLRTPEGLIIGDDLEFAVVNLQEVGLYTGAHIGRVFPILKQNNRSGIKFSLGAGFLQHRIKLVDQGNTVVQLAGDYRKGYDRLTNGFALRQFIGYQHFGDNRLINFFAGIEFTQGFTKNKRAVNFDTMMAETEPRIDGIFAIKIGWTLPVFVGDSDDYFYY